MSSADARTFPKAGTVTPAAMVSANATPTTFFFFMIFLLTVYKFFCFLFFYSFLLWGNRYGIMAAQSFTPPSATPWIKYFCMSTNKTSTGAAIMSDMAMSGPKLTSVGVLKNLNAMVSN